MPIEKPRPWRELLGGPAGAAALALLAVVVIGLGLRYVVTAPPHRLVIATDEPDGPFTRTARAYADRLAAQGVSLQIVQTRGAVENLARLNDPGGGVDLAFVNGGLTDDRRSPHLESLGSVSYDPLWVVVRAASAGDGGLPGLRGQRVGIGPEGSGTAALARTVLGACGVDASNTSLRTTTPDLRAQGDMLSRGDLDAVFVMAPPEDPGIHALLTTDGLAPLDLADAEGLARNMPFLHPLVVPRSTLDPARRAPPRDLSLVASTTTLVARDTVHPALVYLLMSVVDDVHEPPSLLHKENEFPADKDTDLRLSPQAEAYYRSGKPFLQRYLPFGLASAVERLLKVALPVLLLVLPVLRLLPAFNLWRVRRRLARVYRQLLEVEREVYASRASGGGAAEGYETQLRAIEERVRSESVPALYSNELYALRDHVELVRRQIERIARPETPP